jgi:O-antigen ligase
MIRLGLLWLYIFGFALYAWKDWYRSLCAVVFLMCVIEYPDVPKTLLGIQGLNPWNLLFLSVVAAWALTRSRERLRFDLPRHVGILLLLYLAVVIIGVLRIPSGALNESFASMVSELLVNTIKWVLPGLLLFDGCRDRRRLALGAGAILGIYLVLGLLVIKRMPASMLASGEELSYLALKILHREIGYHRVNLSMMLGGASWAFIAARPLFRHKGLQLLMVLLGGLMLYAQALTGGRMGYVTWAVVGAVLGLVRWRRFLPLAPIPILLVLWLVPAARERMLTGFTPESRDTGRVSEAEIPDEGSPDSYTVTSGRSLIWPYVLKKIEDAPIVGYGRQAMQTTGLARFLWEELHEDFPHPHNAYLECLFDNGIVGFLIVVPFYLIVLTHALSLFRDRRDPAYEAIGGMAAALILALLVAAMGSQSFYPREGSVGMWCAIGLMLRVWVERRREDRVRQRAARMRGARPATVPVPAPAVAARTGRPPRTPNGGAPRRT